MMINVPITVLSPSEAWVLHLAIQALQRNARKHPVVSGLWMLWCPVAAAWVEGGAEPVQYVPHPLIRAVEDYARDPKKTLREWIEEYGLGRLLPGLKKYIENVERARERLPHVPAPELLPTFPGATIPLDMKIGIAREITAFGGEEAVLEYVRVWSFVIDDWRRQLPFPEEMNDIRLLEVVIPHPAWRKPPSLTVWAWVNPENHAPWALFAPPLSPVLIALLHYAQSPGKRLWEYAPHIYEATPEGLMNPAVPPIEHRHLLFWLTEIARHHGQNRIPAPAVVTKPTRCEVCPFRTLCFDEMGTAKWEPSPALKPWISGAWT